MDLAKVLSTAKFADKCLEEMGTIKFQGINLEELHPSAIMVTEESLDEHVAIQPTAIAYYGACVAKLTREVDRLNFEFDVWKKQAAMRVKKNQVSDKKLTIGEIEALMYEECKDEVKQKRDEIYEMESSMDSLKALYDGWKQKGFSLREFAHLKEDEWNAEGSISSGQDGKVPPQQGHSGAFSKNETPEERMRRVRELMRKRKTSKPADGNITEIETTETDGATETQVS